MKEPLAELNDNDKEFLIQDFDENSIMQVSHDESNPMQKPSKWKEFIYSVFPFLHKVDTKSKRVVFIRQKEKTLHFGLIKKKIINIVYYFLSLYVFLFNLANSVIFFIYY